MKIQPWLMFLLAALLMAAAAPPAKPAAPSAWDKIKSGALRLVPRGPTRSQSAQRATRMPPEIKVDGTRAGSVLADQQPDVRRDDQVRPATAVETAPPRTKSATGSQRKTSRPGLFSREKRPARTLSQYMAEEKP